MLLRLLVRWLLIFVAVPLVVALIRRLSRALEERGGPTRTSVLLRRSADALVRERAGPSGRRRR